MENRASDSAELLRELLTKLTAAAHLAVDEKLLERLALHWQLLTEANSRFNLTAIREAAPAAEKHYLDCLLAAAALSELGLDQGAAADIGSGGGFPGLVLAAACPEQSWTLIEASRKKADFLAQTAAAMGLDKLSVRPLRAEEAGQEALLRERFALVTARAVAELRVLLEYALPLLTVGGVFMAQKGPDPAEELAAAAPALARLHGELWQSRSLTLPGGEGRTLLFFRKTGPTPAAYPRRPGLPAKRPL